MLQGQPGPGTNLGLEPRRNGEREAGLDQAALHRLQREVRLGAADVVSRRTVGLARGQRQPVVVRETPDLHDGPGDHTSALGSARGRLNASATPGYTTCPSITLSPKNRAASALQACFQPSFARRLA